MKKNLLLLSLLISFFLSSCSKDIEDRLVGNWQLENAWRKELFGRDYFTTGYESGVFTFMENGDATYTSPIDTLQGFWRLKRYSSSYYDGNGDLQSRALNSLRISLINFQQNRFIDLEFDNFDFRNGGQEIKAEQFSTGRDRVYEFERR